MLPTPPAGTAGPSPRTWGERLVPENQERIFRTIPTHVGRTWSSDVGEMLISDHPHARGENASRQLFGNSEYGPSPRTWGELLPVGCDADF